MAKKKKRYSANKRKNNNKNKKGAKLGYIKPQYQNRRKTTVSYGTTKTTTYLSPGQISSVTIPKVRNVTAVTKPKTAPKPTPKPTTKKATAKKRVSVTDKRNNPDYIYNERKQRYYKKSVIERGYKAVEKINKQREEQRKKLLKNKNFNMKYTMTPTKYSELNPLKFNPMSARSEKELEERVRKLEHRATKSGQIESDKRFKNNLIKAINNTVGQETDASTMKSLNWWLRNTSTEDIKKLFYTKDKFDFDYFYTLFLTMKQGETMSDIANNTIEMLRTNRRNKKGSEEE